MAITINEVAREVGISIKTVSRVLNGEAGVSNSTRELVLKTIEQLGYVPNASARRLASDSTSMIGLVIDSCGEYHSQIILRIIEVGEEQGYSVQLIKHLPESHTSRAAIIRLIRQKSVDGLIFTPPCDNDVIFLRMCEAARMPYVRLTPGSLALNSPYVMGNDREGAYLMTQYLISLGHKRIAFLYGIPEHHASQARFDGFAAAMQENNLAVDPMMIRSGNFNFQIGSTSTSELLKLNPRPTAIFASNDESAAGALFAAHQMGVSVPGQLSIAGIDDFQIATKVWPALTTIRQPLYRISEEASNLLIALIEGKTPEHTQICIDEELIIRQSTGPCPE